MFAITSSSDLGLPEKPIAASEPLNNHSDRLRASGLLGHHILSSKIIAIQMEEEIGEEEKEAMSPNRNDTKPWSSSSMAATSDDDTQSASKMQPVPPPPPPIPRPGSIRRYMSEPVPPRRKIFNQFWLNSSNNMNGISRVAPSPPQVRRRSASVSIPQRISTSNNEIDIRHFSPPCRKHCLKSSYFLPIEELPEELEGSLPDLPQPLQRFYREGKQAPLHGMYPLITPVPILRESSYTTGKKSAVFGVESQTPLLHDRTPTSQSEISFQLTDTYRGRGSYLSSDPGLDATSNSSSSQGGLGRTVHFDPRVTVTSFEEKTKREWFTESELERFKWDTIRSAQKFLIMHPELIAAYNMPKLDPVTGTLRKKPLFSMSVLAVGSDDGDSDEEISLGARYMTVDDNLVHQEVQHIMVVDRNKLILDLFRRSLQPLFPQARIITLQSGEEALRMFQDTLSTGLHRSFDIVVAEQALQRPLITTGTPLVQSGKSTNDLQNRAMNAGAEASMKRNMSMTSLSSTGPSKLSGCELFAAIRKKECMSFDTEDGTVHRSIEASSMCQIVWPALLIGVTMQPELDSTLFMQSGADCIWGKPPPKMNESLRDELVMRLIGKRHSVDRKTR